jgi:hypothetical protein
MEVENTSNSIDYSEVLRSIDCECFEVTATEDNTTHYLILVDSEVSVESSKCNVRKNA